MAISKIKTGSITDSAITEAKLGSNAVTTGKISDGTIVNADISPSAAIASSKTVICTAVTDSNAFNISLLGFKMAVNEGLTVFNLVDGVVDEFHDESGTDEAEGSNDSYCATSDYYINSTSPTGASVSVKAGFSMTAITEPDTSTTATNPAAGAGTFGTFTVPGGLTSANLFVYGAAGGSGIHQSLQSTGGGGGGFAAGALAVTGGQTLYISAGEGGNMAPCSSRKGGFFGGGNSGSAAPGKPTGPQVASTCSCSSGGGVAGVFSVDYPTLSPAIGQPTAPGPQGPTIFMIAGAGGGGGGHGPTPGPASLASPVHIGGVGGGLSGGLGGYSGATQVNAAAGAGGGGDQEQGGQGGQGPQSGQTDGKFLEGADSNGPDRNIAAGGAGYFGGGNGNYGPTPQSPSDNRSGGGGSSYYGHPQVTSGVTEAGAGTINPANPEETLGGGQDDPTPGDSLTPQIGYSAGRGESPGSAGQTNANGTGQDGYVFITGCVSASTTSTTIVSTAFTATSVPTTSRIVVFEENVDTPTLNTDIIASISRDGGSNFTTATLTDSGYVTGSSGQRILTGQATISGQPSGQSMRWKLALANNAVKIHGVSLQWA